LSFFSKGELSSPKSSAVLTITTLFGFLTSYSGRSKQPNPLHPGSLCFRVAVVSLTKWFRNVSAEIFVVCRDFLAPKHIDPKFLDPRHVFKDLAASISSEKGTSTNDVQANVFHPEKKRRQRAGYADGDYTLFKTVSATDFIKGPDPVTTLGSFNKITFTTEEEKE
jgi:hypothetical protein